MDTNGQRTGHPVLDSYDGLLVDLDGTVYRGGAPVPGAAGALTGRRVVYVTNNASRSPREVADQLRSLGVPAADGDVLTSAQAACRLAREVVDNRGLDHPGRPRAYVVGAASFGDLARTAGFAVVDGAAAHPDVVLHGHSPENDWARLSEAALAIRAGAVYVASNMDTTLPTERGLLVGNGSMVAAVVSATGVTPVSAGKPGPAMFHVAADQIGASRPLAVGDRLDTDIAGGIAAGMDTLCVLTGVATHRELLHTTDRPTHIAANLRDHLPGWSAREEDGRVTVSAGEPGPVEVAAAEALAVAAPLVWAADDAARTVEVVGGDAVAAAAVEAWR